MGRQSSFELAVTFGAARCAKGCWRGASPLMRHSLTLCSHESMGFMRAGFIKNVSNDYITLQINY